MPKENYITGYTVEITTDGEGNNIYTLIDPYNTLNDCKRIKQLLNCVYLSDLYTAGLPLPTKECSCS